MHNSMLLFTFLFYTGNTSFEQIWSKKSKLSFQDGILYWQYQTKYSKQNREIQQNWTGQEKFWYRFWRVFWLLLPKFISLLFFSFFLYSWQTKHLHNYQCQYNYQYSYHYVIKALEHEYIFSKYSWNLIKNIILPIFRRVAWNHLNNCLHICVFLHVSF